MLDTIQLKKDFYNKLRPNWTTIYADEWLSFDDVQMIVNPYRKEIEFYCYGRKSPFITPSGLFKLEQAMKEVPNLKLKYIHKKYIKPGKISWVNYGVYEIGTIVFKYN